MERGSKAVYVWESKSWNGAYTAGAARRSHIDFLERGYTFDIEIVGKETTKPKLNI